MVKINRSVNGTILYIFKDLSGSAVPVMVQFRTVEEHACIGFVMEGTLLAQDDYRRMEVGPLTFNAGDRLLYPNAGTYLFSNGTSNSLAYCLSPVDKNTTIQEIDDVSLVDDLRSFDISNCAYLVCGAGLVNGEYIDGYEIGVASIDPLILDGTFRVILFQVVALKETQ